MSRNMYFLAALLLSSISMSNAQCEIESTAVECSGTPFACEWRGGSCRRSPSLADHGNVEIGGDVYFIADMNSADCPAGSSSITDAECRQYYARRLEQSGASSDSHDHWVYWYSDEDRIGEDWGVSYPCGCIIDDYLLTDDEHTGGADGTFNLGLDCGGTDEDYAPVCKKPKTETCKAKGGSKWTSGRCKRECDDDAPKKNCHKKCHQYCADSCRCTSCDFVEDDADWSIMKPKKHRGKGCSWLAEQDPSKIKKFCRRWSGQGGQRELKVAWNACQYTCHQCAQQWPSV